MFEIAWTKLLIIAIVAIVVVGPKDLPRVMRTVGRFMGELRKHADEFKRQFNDAIRDTEIEQVKKDLEDTKRTLEKAVDMSEVERQIERELPKPASFDTPAVGETKAIESPRAFASAAEQAAAAAAEQATVAQVMAGDAPAPMPLPPISNGHDTSADALGSGEKKAAV